MSIRPNLQSKSNRTAPFTHFAPSLLVLLMLGCGGSDGSVTAPLAVEGVSGAYRITRALAAVSCVPQSPPAVGGTVILNAFSDTVRARVLQTGSKLTVTYTNFPGSPPDTGSVTPNGTWTIGFKDSFQEAPRGARTFFVDLTVSEELRPAESSSVLAGSGTYVNVFHEGAAAAPVFATCSRTSKIEATRLSD